MKIKFILLFILVLSFISCAQKGYIHKVYMYNDYAIYAVQAGTFKKVYVVVPKNEAKDDIEFKITKKSLGFLRKIYIVESSKSVGASYTKGKYTERTIYIKE